MLKPDVIALFYFSLHLLLAISFTEYHDLGFDF